MPTCKKCGHKIIRDFAGWTHAPESPLPPRELRHRPIPEEK